MPFDIITINPVTTAAAYAADDVAFDLTKVDLPSRACKLIKVEMEVSGGTEANDCKIGILFFRKNTNVFGTANGAVSISASEFTANEYIGQTFVGFNDNLNSSDGAGSETLLPNVIDNVAFYYACQWSTDTSATGQDGESKSLFEPMVLEGTAGNTEVYAAGLIHDGTPTFGGTDKVKIHFHVEY